MTSDTIVRPDLVDHLLRAEALKLNVDCELHVKFLVYDPSIPGYKPLEQAKIDLVRSDGITMETGKTDNNGVLWETINAPNPNDPIVIKKINKLADGLTFHFNVVGDAVSGGNLASKVWYGTKHYPVASWSTEGWIEPDGQSGTFRPNGTTMGEAGTEKVFRVGVAYCFDLKYLKRNNLETSFPYGLTISTLVNDQEKATQVTEFGKPITNVIFEIKPDDDITFEMPLEIEEDSSINQQSVELSIAGFPKNFLTIGTLLKPALDTAHNNRTELFMGDARLAPAPLSNAASDKLCKAANFLVGFAEHYRRFSNVMHRLADGTVITTGNPGLAWEGLPFLRVEVDQSQVTESYCSPRNPVNGRYPSTLTLFPSPAGFPSMPTSAHELGHAFMNWYYFDVNDIVPGGDHFFHTAKSARFAYSEGFAEFISLLFATISDLHVTLTYYLWRTLFSANWADRPWDIVDDNGASVENMLTDDIGFKIEGAFAFGLYAVWVELVRGSPVVANGEGRHVLVEEDGGEVTGIKNAWLNAALKNRAKTYIWDAVRLAVGSSAQETSIDVLQKVTELGMNDPNWHSVHDTFLTLSLKFPLVVLTLGGFAVVSSANSSGDFVLSPQGSRIQCTAGQANTILLQAEYAAPNSTAALPGAANSSVVVAFVSMKQSNITITANAVGTFDLAITSEGQTRTIKHAIQVS